MISSNFERISPGNLVRRFAVEVNTATSPYNILASKFGCGRSVPGRSDQMGIPSQRQAHEYQQHRAVEENDWSERDYEERPDRRGCGPTDRSQS